MLVMRASVLAGARFLLVEVMAERFIGFIEAGELWKFYTSRAWRRLRHEVLLDFNYECQDCKAEGFYSRAVVVHHEKYVRDFPLLCMSKLYIEDGKQKRNLVPLCERHHELRHPERMKHVRQESAVVERWD